MFSFLAFLSINYSCKTDSNRENNSDTSTINKAIVKSDFTLLNDKIAADPRNPELLYQRAQVFLQKNNTRQAFDDIRNAVSVDSSKSEYYFFGETPALVDIIILDSLDQQQSCRLIK